MPSLPGVSEKATDFTNARAAVAASVGQSQRAMKITIAAAIVCLAFATPALGLD
jgi:hypothetical protein